MREAVKRGPAVKPGAPVSHEEQEKGHVKRLIARMFKPEKDREKEMEAAEKQQKKEMGIIESILEKLSGEERLYRRRLELQERKRKELEREWGEDVARIVIHYHCAGAANGYEGSPDGTRYLGLKKVEGKPSLLTLLIATGVDAIVLTDHDAFKPSQMRKLKEVVDEINSTPGMPTVIVGTELTSAAGHFIILERGKPLLNPPEWKNKAQAMAEWAFQNGYDIMIPHPNPSRFDPKRIAAYVFGIDIGIEKEVVESILRIADMYDKFVYIAYANGTTTTDYKANLLGSRDHWWQFWRPKRVDRATAELYARRAIWVAEGDVHIRAEAPSNCIYVRRSQVIDGSGRISAKKLSQLAEKQKRQEYIAFKEGKTIPEKDRLIVSYSADEDFNILDRAAMVPYFVREYLRLVAVWLVKVLTGKAGQYAEKPKRPIKLEYRRAQVYEEED